MSRTRGRLATALLIGAMGAAPWHGPVSAEADVRGRPSSATSARPRSKAGAGSAGQVSSLPAVTLLYQNFPNPFPTPATAITCIWFDLHTPSRVHLTIHDVRGTVVRTIVPGPFFSTFLAAGRFGRGNPDANTGCDPRFSWDGTDETGRRVTQGVYLVRLKTERYEGIKKILFRAP